MSMLKTLMLMLALVGSVSITVARAVDELSDSTSSDSVSIAIRLQDRMDAGEFEAASETFTPQMKAALVSTSSRPLGGSRQQPAPSTVATRRSCSCAPA